VNSGVYRAKKNETKRIQTIRGELKDGGPGTWISKETGFKSYEKDLIQFWLYKILKTVLMLQKKWTTYFLIPRVIGYLTSETVSNNSSYEI